MMKQDVDWNEPPLERWLGTITRRGTLFGYRSGFRLYAKYTGMSASQLVDEALEDAKRDAREKRDIVLTRVLGFYKWLKEEHEVKSRGKGPHEVVRKGLSDNLANMYVTSVRSFYSTYDIVLRLKGRHRLPRPKKSNKRLRVGAEQVKVLVDHARSPKDRATILTMFQSGMDVSTLCSLNYNKELEESLARNDHPLRLDLYRPKTGVEYYTFLGRDSVEAIKAYLRDAEKRGINFTYNMPLFVKRKAERLKPHNIQNMLREVAVSSGFVDENMNGGDFNPLSPHALRESFGSIMINSGVPDTIVDFWLGHAIGDMARAYKGVQNESLRQMYLDRERLLSISQPKVDVEEIEKKVRVEVEQSSREVQALVNRLAGENINLRERVERLERIISELADVYAQLKREKSVLGAGE